MNTRNRWIILGLSLVAAVCVCEVAAASPIRGCPELVATVSSGTYSPKIIVSENVTYVIEGGGRLTILDTTTPTQPAVTWSGTVCDPYYDEDVFDAAVSAGTMFALYAPYGPSSWQELCVVDVSSPALPIRLGSEGFELDEPIRSLAVSGGYAYLVSHPVNNMMDLKLRVFDVMVPSSPVEIGGLYLHPGPDEPVDITVAGGHAYIAGQSWLAVIDVVVPSSPVYVGSLDIVDGADRLAVSGNYAYVAGPTGLRVIDVSTPSAPSEVGFVDIEGDVTGITVVGDLVYVSMPEGLRVIDVRIPSSPVVVGVAELPLAWDVAASGHYAYVVGEEGVFVFDASGCRHPVDNPLLHPAVD